MKSNQMTRSGREISVATMRGVIRYSFELTPRISIASICSLTRIVPSSADIALMEREISISDANTGPSSRVIEK